MAVTVTSLNHVSLVTKRLDESRRFYANILGAKEISRPGFNFPGAWLYLSGIQIHLIGVGDPGDPGAINTRTDHVAFAVPDVDEAERHLNELGIPYRRSLIPDRGIHQLFFHDPDGHTIELGKYSPRIDE
jgi:catechol 2,3-dioxygenase-like lactoylglutathione lyase family enzyme